MRALSLWKLRAISIVLGIILAILVGKLVTSHFRPLPVENSGSSENTWRRFHIPPTKGGTLIVPRNKEFCAMLIDTVDDAEEIRVLHDSETPGGKMHWTPSRTGDGVDMNFEGHYEVGKPIPLTGPTEIPVD